MKQETKKYLLTVEVDLDALIAAYVSDEEGAYTGGDDSIQLYDLPPIDEIILFECGWLSSSGIQVKQIEKVQQ